LRCASRAARETEDTTDRYGTTTYKATQILRRHADGIIFVHSEQEKQPAKRQQKDPGLTPIWVKKSFSSSKCQERLLFNGYRCICFRGQSGRSMKLTTDTPIVPILRSGALPQIPICVHGVYRNNFTLLISPYSLVQYVVAWHQMLLCCAKLYKGASQFLTRLYLFPDTNITPPGQCSTVPTAGTLQFPSNIVVNSIFTCHPASHSTLYGARCQK